MSILAGRSDSFLKLCGDPTGMLANVPAVATTRSPLTVNVISPSRDVEAFLLPAVDVRGWPAARRHEGFP
ncbi:MAG: hypothetical protein U0804_18335 [Gemmataceae bacterium]